MAPMLQALLAMPGESGEWAASVHFRRSWHGKEGQGKDEARSDHGHDVYGKAPEEIAQVRYNLEVFEPLLRSIATHEIGAGLPLDGVAAAILALGGDDAP